jgi:serine/threonine protein kinase
MISTLKQQFQDLRSCQTVTDDNVHSMVMNLVESVIRLVAIIAITAYRYNGCKNVNSNKLVGNQLPWPSMGSWKNIISSLLAVSENDFPPQFKTSFLTPLGLKIKNDDVSLAFGLLKNVVEYASNPDINLINNSRAVVCRMIDFFDLVVAYRNHYAGHGTHDLTDIQIQLIPLLRKGMLALENPLAKMFLKYPVYIAEHAKGFGCDHVNLNPVIKDGVVKSTSFTKDEVTAGQLYIIPEKNKVASLFPIAIWENSDILFLNGSEDFKKIKYVGFVSKGQFKTSLHEKAFCEFMLPFMGGQNLTSSNLTYAQASAQAEMLKAYNWRFPTLKPGMVVGPSDTQFRLKEKIGRGGMAEVWAATSEYNKQDVALKFLLDLDNAPRFRREARALDQFSKKSDRIVQYIDFFYDPHPARRTFFLVMELLPGKTLQNEVDVHSNVDFGPIINWMEDCLEALGTIHDNGAIHRDIKPSNLMLDRKDRVKLGDLGLVGMERNAIAQQILTTAGLTQIGVAIGTYAYSSPEQLAAGTDGQEIDSRADLFSLGATFYQIITGEYPYGMENQTVVTKAHMEAIYNRSRGPKPVSNLRPECPNLLNHTIMSLIQVQRDQRPSDVKTVLDLLRQTRKELKGEKVNINLNLFGELGASDVEFKDLMPYWCSTYIFKIWLLAMVLQFLFVIPGSIISGAWNTIDPALYNLGHVNYKILHPFCNDIMFLVWNSIPFLFIGLLYRARICVQALIQQIYSKDADKRGSHWTNISLRNDKWAGFINHWAVKVGILAIALFACYVQITKLPKLESIGEIYWWDWKISKFSYIVREVALFFDMIGMALLFIVVVAMVDMISHILRGTKLQIDLHHSDGVSGLSFVGKLISLYVPFVIVLSANMVVGIIDHHGQDVKQVVADWVVLGLTIGLYFFLTVWPMIPVKRQIVSYRNNQIRRYARQRVLVEDKIDNLVDSSLELDIKKADAFFTLRKLSADLSTFEESLHKSFRWPIKKIRAVMLIFLGIVPIATSVSIVFVLS